jgi:hypothetical protein
MHWIQRSTLTTQGKMKLLMMAVRLFGHSGTSEHGLPVYYAIVGAPLVAPPQS